jgi:D-3-phosphoglycerate dehydrogenase / 2-oxoglutarate reductase
MKKILITDPVDKKCEQILISEGFEVHSAVGIKADELKKIIGSYNALIVRSETKADASLISLMDNMEVIGRAGAGVDNININAATRKGILVMNTPGGNTISAAEHTMALILSLCRNIPQAAKSLSESRWDRKKFTGSELYGKTILILGFGKIGKEVAVRAASFSMNVLAYDPVISSTAPGGPKVEFVDLDEGFTRADFITLHVPLSNITRNLINEESLKKCKHGVRIINCARGGIVNEMDVLHAIDSGKISGAAFDVFENEPPDFSNPIFNHPKIICTPHLGASTEEAQEKVAVQIAEQVSDYFKNKIFSGAVNTLFTSIDEKLAGYLSLAQKIGHLQSQMLKGNLNEIKVRISGDFLHFNTNLITSALLTGFLSERSHETVNFINAPVILKDSGISLSETKDPDDENFNNVITTVFISDTNERLISGTVFGTKEERILRIDDELVEFSPEGNYIIYYNVDKPGVLANVSKALAESGYNISGVSLGRNAKGERALSIIGLDGEPDNLVMNRITGTDGILEVYLVNFKDGR